MHKARKDKHNEPPHTFDYVRARADMLNAYTQTKYGFGVEIVNRSSAYRALGKRA